jgi:hypothetical protein
MHGTTVKITVNIVTIVRVLPILPVVLYMCETWFLIPQKNADGSAYCGTIYLITMLLSVRVIPEMARKRFFLDIKEGSVPPGAL